jgi:hypothetical protein
LILSDWSGEEFKKWHRIEDSRRVAQLRMLMIKLAIHAYKLQQNRLPETLDELVPRYLPHIPIDPFGAGKLLYRLNGDEYLVYSRGPDEDDDGGQPRTVENEKSAT